MFPGIIPPSPVTAVTVPDLGLVVAGDAIYNGVHMYLGAGVAAGGSGPSRNPIDKIEALNPRHIIAGRQNQQLDHGAGRLIAETRQCLDDADQLLETEKTAVDFFHAKLKRYPNHLGRTVLWVVTSIIYGLREHNGEDVGAITVNAWL